MAIHAKEPILLMGPTGAGKSQLARRIFELKKCSHQVVGALVEVNCATLHIRWGTTVTEDTQRNGLV